MQLCQASMVALSLACWPAQALGQADLLAPETFEVNADLRGSVVGGEDSFLEGGFGKLRYGGGDGDTVPRARLASLVHAGFLRDTPPALLSELPRYLKALRLRAERAIADPVKDQARMLVLRPFDEALDRARAAGGGDDPEQGFCFALRRDGQEDQRRRPRPPRRAGRVFHFDPAAARQIRHRGPHA
jgi:hypothetical protein